MNLSHPKLMAFSADNEIHPLLFLDNEDEEEDNLRMGNNSEDDEDDKETEDQWDSVSDEDEEELNAVRMFYKVDNRQNKEFKPGKFDFI